MLQASTINLILSGLVLLLLILGQFYTPSRTPSTTTILNRNSAVLSLEKDCNSQLVKNYYFVKALTDYKNYCASGENHCGLVNDLGAKIDSIISHQLEKSLPGQCGNVIINNEQVVPIFKKEQVDPTVVSICSGSGTNCMKAVYQMVMYQHVFNHVKERANNLNTSHIQHFMEMKISQWFDQPEKVSHFIKTTHLQAYSGFDISIEITDDSVRDRTITLILTSVMAVLIVMLYKSVNLEQLNFLNRIVKLQKDLEVSNQLIETKKGQLDEVKKSETTLVRSVSTLKDEILMLNTQNECKIEKLTTINNQELKNQEQAIFKLEEKIEDIKHQNSNLKGSVATYEKKAKENAKQMKKEKDDFEQNLKKSGEALETLRKESEQRVQFLTQQSNTLEEEKAKLIKSNDEQRINIEKASQELLKLGNDNRRMEGNCSSLRREVLLLEEKEQVLKLQLEESKTQMVILKVQSSAKEEDMLKTLHITQEELHQEKSQNTLSHLEQLNLNEKIQNLTVLVNNLDKEKETSLKEIQTLDTELIEIEKLCEDLENERLSLLNKLQQEYSEKKELQEKFQESDLKQLEEIKMLNTELMDATNLCEDLNNDRLSKQQEIAKLKNIILESENKLSSYIQEHELIEGELIKAKGEVDTWMQAHEKLEEKIKLLEDDKAALYSENAVLKGQEIEYSKKLENQSKEIQSLSKEKDKIANDLNEAKSYHVTKMKNYKVELTKLEKTIQELKQSKSKTLNELKTVRQECSKLKAQDKNQHMNLDGQYTEINSLKLQLSETENLLSCLKKESDLNIQDLVRDREQFIEKLKATSEELKVISQEKQDIEHSFKAQSMKSEEIIQFLTKEKDNALNKSDSLENDITNLREKVRQLETIEETLSNENQQLVENWKSLDIKLKETKHESEKKMYELTKEINESKETIEKHFEDNRKLVEQMQETESSLYLLEIENENLTTQKIALVEEIQTKTEELLQKQNYIEDLEQSNYQIAQEKNTQKEEKDNEIQNLKTQLTDLNTILVKIQTEFEVKREEMVTTIDEISFSKDTLSDVVQSQKDQLHKSQESIDSKEREVNELKLELSKHLQMNTDLETSLTNLSAQSQAVREDLVAQNTTLSEMLLEKAGSCSNLSKNLNTVREYMQELCSKLIALKLSIPGMEEDVTTPRVKELLELHSSENTFEILQGTINIEIVELQELISKHTNPRVKTEKFIESLKENVTREKKEKENLHKTVQSLTMDIEAKEKKIKILEGESMKTTEKLGILISEKEILSNHLSEKETNVTALQEELRRKDEEISKHLEEIGESQKEVEQLRQSILEKSQTEEVLSRELTIVKHDLENALLNIEKVTTESKEKLEKESTEREGLENVVSGLKLVEKQLLDEKNSLEEMKKQNQLEIEQLSSSLGEVEKKLMERSTENDGLTKEKEQLENALEQYKKNMEIELTKKEMDLLMEKEQTFQLKELVHSKTSEMLEIACIKEKELDLFREQAANDIKSLELELEQEREKSSKMEEGIILQTATLKLMRDGVQKVIEEKKKVVDEEMKMREEEWLSLLGKEKENSKTEITLLHESMKVMQNILLENEKSFQEQKELLESKQNELENLKMENELEMTELCNTIDRLNIQIAKQEDEVKSLTEAISHLQRDDDDKFYFTEQDLHVVSPQLFAEKKDKLDDLQRTLETVGAVAASLLHQ